MTSCFFIAISLTSCEKDLYEDAIQNSSRDISVTHVSLSGLDKTTSYKINEKITLLKNLSKKTNSQGRFEYNSALDIYIDTENGKLVNNNGKLYYTFPMFRKTEENLENIIFTTLASGEMETYFARYNVTPEVFKDLTTTEIENLNLTFQKIDANSVLVNICTTTEFTITTYPNCSYPGGIHTDSNGTPIGINCNGESVTYSYTICSLNVSFGGGGGDNGVGTVTGTGVTSDGGGNPVTGITISPIGLSTQQIEIKLFIKDLTPAQHSWFNNQFPLIQNSITSLINEGLNPNASDCLSGSSAATDLINFCLEHNDNEEDSLNSLDAILSMINDCSSLNPDNDSDVTLPASCESFNFTTVGDIEWQQAAVKNIKFRVVLLNSSGVIVLHNIRFPNATLFGLPTNTTAFGDVSPGFAANLSAQALQISINETVALYGNQFVGEAVVRYYFIERLKHNYQIITNGGRVNFNVLNSPVTPTQYITTAIFPADCDD